jgi:hypothetical protein
MPEGLSMSSVQVFPCPNCNETINTSMQQCAFCSAPIDRASAAAAAEATSRVSAACSEASYLKIMGGLAFSLFLLSIFNITGIVSLVYLLIVFPAAVIRWWFKHGSIRTSDPDFPPAKLTASYAAGGAAISALYIVAKLLFHV